MSQCCCWKLENLMATAHRFSYPVWLYSILEMISTGGTWQNPNPESRLVWRMGWVASGWKLENNVVRARHYYHERVMRSFLKLLPWFPLLGSWVNAFILCLLCIGICLSSLNSSIHIILNFFSLPGPFSVCCWRLKSSPRTPIPISFLPFYQGSEVGVSFSVFVTFMEVGLHVN